MMLKDEKLFKKQLQFAKLIAKVSEKKQIYSIIMNEDKQSFFTMIDMGKVKLIGTNNIELGKKQKIEEIMQQFYKSQRQISSYMLKYTSFLISNSHIYFFHEPFDCTLRKLLKNKLTYTQKINLMTTIALALEDIHLKRFCLRTLKPEVIGIRRKDKKQDNQQFQAIFLGIKELEQLDNNNKVNGLLLCILMDSIEQNSLCAPEVSFLKQYTLQSDIWSLGLIFGEIMCANFLTHYKKEKQLKFDENIPQWFSIFILKMMNQNPENRHSIKDIVFILKKAQFCSPSFQKFYSN